MNFRFFVALAVALLCSPALLHGLDYTYTTLQLPGAMAPIRAEAINDVGDIVGTYSDSSGTIHGFFYSAGSFRPVDFPGATPGSTVPLGVNNSGTIVGRYANSQGVFGFIDAGNVFTTIPAPAGPIAINNNGQIAGTTSNPSGGTEGFVYNNGTLTPVNSPVGSNTTFWAINDLGQIAGMYQDSNGVTRTLLYSNGTFTFPPIPGAGGPGSPFDAMTVNGINDIGQIAVSRLVMSQRIQGGTLYSDYGKGNTTVGINDPNAPLTIIGGINNRAQVVGGYFTGPGTPSLSFLATPDFSTAVPGDANLDGTVDFNDLLVLAQNYGKTSGVSFVQGDFNQDNVINFSDLLILAQHYQRVATAVASTVPEPGSAIALVGASLLLVRRRK